MLLNHNPRLLQYNVNLRKKKGRMLNTCTWSKFSCNETDLQSSCWLNRQIQRPFQILGNGQIRIQLNCVLPNDLGHTTNFTAPKTTFFSWNLISWNRAPSDGRTIVLFACHRLPRHHWVSYKDNTITSHLTCSVECIQHGRCFSMRAVRDIQRLD
jgi:hypothetical protein